MALLFSVPARNTKDLMMDQNARPARKVTISDHIWDAFEQMADSMGSDRDALINQAMFMFARLNGFLAVTEGLRGAARGDLSGASKPAPPVASPRSASLSMPSVSK